MVMKNVLIFGFGEIGKKLIDECLDFQINKKIVAIIDNNCEIQTYRDIPIIRPSMISNYIYDEIWICTVYFKEIMTQLSEQYQVPKHVMHYAEPVMPILDERIRQKYKYEIENADDNMSDKKVLFQYLKKNPAHMYCYPFYDEYLMKNTPIQYDENNGLFYGIYEQKKLYFSRKMNTEQKARAYFNSMLMEQDRRTPHCYWNFDKLADISGVGVDVGAAEGIFALKVIDQIEHIYLVEVEEEWIEALQHTFVPYKEKVTIIQKYIANEDNADSAKLDTLFHSQRIDFMKMDIEGMEFEALKGAEKLLSDNNMILAVCVYHHGPDNEIIGNWLKDRDYGVRNSEGYILCQGDWELENEEINFRRGLIYAYK